MEEDKHAARKGYKEMKGEEPRESGVVDTISPPHPHNHSTTNIRQGSDKVSDDSGPSIPYLAPR